MVVGNAERETTVRTARMTYLQEIHLCGEAPSSIWLEKGERTQVRPKANRTTTKSVNQGGNN
jgi:hypothetical protein